MEIAGEALGNIGKAQREERDPEEEDSLILELVDLLDVKKKDQTYGKTRSAVQSPHCKQLSLACRLPLAKTEPKRSLLLPKFRPTKLVFRGRLTHSTGIPPLLNLRPGSKLPKVIGDFPCVQKPV